MSQATSKKFNAALAGLLEQLGTRADQPIRDYHRVTDAQCDTLGPAGRDYAEKHAMGREDEPGECEAKKIFGYLGDVITGDDRVLRTGRASRKEFHMAAGAAIWCRATVSIAKFLDQDDEGDDLVPEDWRSHYREARDEAEQSMLSTLRAEIERAA